MKQNLSPRKKRVKKFGTAAFAGGILLLALLAVVNFGASALPAKLSKLEVTGKGLTEMTAESKKLVSDLKEDVTIYWICEDDVIDTSLIGEWFELLLTRYAEASDHITVKRVNTKADQAFAEKYGTDDYNNHSFVVESARRSTIVDATELYLYSNTYVNRLVQSEYIMTMEELENMQYYVYYTQQGVDILNYQTYQYTCCNAKLASAIDFVTRETVPHGYLLTGYEGTEPTEDFVEYLSLLTEKLDTVDLSTATSIPEDANCVVLYAPTADLSSTQTAVLKGYLDRGGSLLLATSPSSVQNCPNILALAADFGLSASPGLVVDNQSGYYAAGASTDVLTPSVNRNHDVYMVYENYKFVPRMPQSHAIATAKELPDGVSVTPIFTTSGDATRRELGNVTNVLGEAGKMNVAVSATRPITTADGTVTTAGMVWFGSTDAFNAETAAAIKNGNYYYLAVAFSGISKTFTSTYENIAPVRLTPNSLDISHSVTVVMTIAVLVVIIPFGLLTVGIVTWARRRKRR